MAEKYTKMDGWMSNIDHFNPVEKGNGSRPKELYPLLSMKISKYRIYLKDPDGAVIGIIEYNESAHDKEYLEQQIKRAEFLVNAWNIALLDNKII